MVLKVLVQINILKYKSVSQHRFFSPKIIGSIVGRNIFFKNLYWRVVTKILFPNAKVR